MDGRSIGGYTTDVVLLHGGDGSEARGEVILYDNDEAQVRRQSYSIESGKHWLWELTDDRAVPRTYYAVVEGRASAAALVSRTDDGLISSTSRMPTPLVKHARVPIDTRAISFATGDRQSLPS